MKVINLSPSKLNLFNESRQCFWDAYSGKCPRPRGIFPSLPGGMDLTLKAWVENYRGKMPPQLQGKLPGVLWNDPRLKSWQNWRTGATYYNEKHAVKLVGALDDMLIDANNVVSPLDWKTKGSEPKDNGAQYYQTQLDCYTLMSKANGLKVNEKAYLVYLYPDKVSPEAFNHESLRLGIGFRLLPFELTTSVARAEEIIIKAAECLRGPRPKGPEPENEYWRYIQGKILLERSTNETGN